MYEDLYNIIDEQPDIELTDGLDVTCLTGDPRAVHEVFVYGTLRLGHCNASRIAGRCQRISAYYTEQSTFSMWAFITSGGYLAPYVERVTAGHHIRGELIRVRGDVLQELDLFEGHPDFYRRELVTVVNSLEPTNDRHLRQAWMYIWQSGHPIEALDRNVRHMSLSNYQEFIS